MHAVWVVLAVLMLAWFVGALFENGPTWPAVIILMLLVWALIDKAG